MRTFNMDLSDAIKRRNKRIDKDLVDLMAGRVEARYKNDYIDSFRYMIEAKEFRISTPWYVKLWRKMKKIMLIKLF